MEKITSIKDYIKLKNVVSSYENEVLVQNRQFFDGAENKGVFVLRFFNRTNEFQLIDFSLNRAQASKDFGIELISAPTFELKNMYFELVRLKSVNSGGPVVAGIKIGDRNVSSLDSFSANQYQNSVIDMVLNACLNEGFEFECLLMPQFDGEILFFCSSLDDEKFKAAQKNNTGYIEAGYTLVFKGADQRFYFTQPELYNERNPDLMLMRGAEHLPLIHDVPAQIRNIKTNLLRFFSGNSFRGSDLRMALVYDKNNSDVKQELKDQSEIFHIQSFVSAYAFQDTIIDVPVKIDFSLLDKIIFPKTDFGLILQILPDHQQPTYEKVTD